MANNITIDLDTVDKETLRILKSAKLGDDIVKKIEINELVNGKNEVQTTLDAINERLAELRK